MYKVDGFLPIPQAPNYEMNNRGVVRNRKTGYILKWGGRTTPEMLLRGGDKRVHVTLSSLMWQMFGKRVGKSPCPVTVTSGNRRLFFESKRSCARFLAKNLGLTSEGARRSLTNRCPTIGGWKIRYL